MKSHLDNNPEAVAERRSRIEQAKLAEQNRQKARDHMNQCRAPQLTVKLGSFWPEA